MLRDRLVVGTKDSALSAQLQLDPELTLDKAKMRIRQREAVGQQQAELKGDTPLSTPVDTVHSKRQYREERNGIRPHPPPPRSSSVYRVLIDT